MLFGVIGLSPVLEVTGLVIVAGKPPPPPADTAETGAAVQAWKDVNRGYLDIVDVDLQSIPTAVHSGSEPDTAAACSAMTEHLRTAQSAPPLAASDVNDAWRGFLTAYSQGTKLCAEVCAGTTAGRPMTPVPP